MDLIVEEIEIVKKVASVNKVNFNLSKLWDVIGILHLLDNIGFL